MSHRCLTAVLAFLLAACGDAPGPPAAAGPDTAQLRIAAESAAVRDSVAREAEGRALTAEGWNTGPTSVQVSAGTLVTLREVRSTAHEGFDRIVFDFGSQSMPNFEVAFADGPVTRCGSGEAVALKGGAALVVKLQPVQAHDDAGKATVPEGDRDVGGRNLLLLALTCDSGAQVAWAAGLARATGYRTIMMQQPNRLVVDIRH